MTSLALFTLAWKSTLASASTLLIARASAGRSCSDRVAVLKFGAILLLALPLLAFVVPATNVFVRPIPVQVAQIGSAGVLPAAVTPASASAAQSAGFGDRIAPVYWIGFIVIVLQLVVGLAVLLRWTARAKEVDSRIAARAALLLAPGRLGPRVLASPHVRSPLSWGFLRPVILLDEKSLTDPRSIDAILAHELAHVRHGDWSALMVMRAVVAIFWFNPLVWMLARALEEQMERAADQSAACLVGANDYAQALLIQGRRASAAGMPALSIAPRGGRLSRRILALFNEETSRAQLTTEVKLGGAAIGLAYVTMIASLGFAVAPPASAEQPVPRSDLAPTVDADVSQNRPLGVRQLARRRDSKKEASSALSLRNPAPAAIALDAQPQTSPSVEVSDQLAASQMERDAGTMDHQADAIDAQARIVRQEATVAGALTDARRQAERQAETLESAAAALRGSANATRFNAAALRRNGELESRPSQGP